MYELFRGGVGLDGRTMDKEAFLRLCSEHRHPSQTEAENVFKHHAPRSLQMTFEQFQNAFKSHQPSGLELETQVIRQVREWMFNLGLSSEQAFGKLCKSVGHNHAKRLTRQQFYNALIVNNVGLSAAQIDSLYTLLASEANGELDLNMWLSRIYEDGDNILQMMREVVMNYNFTQEDLLHQMRLKPWSDPLNREELTKAIRLLDASVSDS